jgi:hypothetical protein
VRPHVRCGWPRSPRVAVDECIGVLLEQGNEHLLQRHLIVFVVASQLTRRVSRLNDQSRGGQAGRLVSGLCLQQDREIAQQSPARPAQFDQQVHEGHLHRVLALNHQDAPTLRAGVQAQSQAFQSGRSFQTRRLECAVVSQAHLQVATFGGAQPCDREFGAQRFAQRRLHHGRAQRQGLRRCAPGQQAGDRDAAPPRAGSPIRTRQHRMSRRGARAQPDEGRTQSGHG